MVRAAPTIATKLLLLLIVNLATAQKSPNLDQNQIGHEETSMVMNRNPCRPDQVFTDGVCVRLKLSLSDLVREILENSESSLTFLHYQSDSQGNNATVIAPHKVPVSDLFIQNLAVISEANMSNCLAEATCNEHCLSWRQRTAEQQKYEEEVLDRFVYPPLIAPELTSKSKDDFGNDDEDGSAPDFVRTIMEASKSGIHLARSAPAEANLTAVCGSACNGKYKGCSPLNYDYTTRINAIYRKLVEVNATLFDKAPQQNQSLSPEILYYHYSMQFLDLANLTSCYAQVSCENSCSVYKATISDRNVEMVGPPPTESTFLKEDANRPKAIDIIHNGAILGYKFALESTCEECGRQYKDCTADRYEIAKASSTIFG